MARASKRCPGSTGNAGCGAAGNHACILPRDHGLDPAYGDLGTRLQHQCCCGYRWTCMTGSIDDLFATLRSAEESRQ